MHSSAGRLALTILGTILFLQAAVVPAAPPPVPGSAVAPAPAETIEAPAPLCAEESAAPFVDLEPLEQTGQPSRRRAEAPMTGPVRCASSSAAGW
jgi:hypothetical protein